MPVHRRRSFVRSGSAQRRKLVWATNSGLGLTPVVNSPFNVDLLSNFRAAGGSTVGATVMRTHVRFSLAWEVTPASSQAFTYGLTVADMDLVTAGSITTGERGRDWAILDQFMPGCGSNAFTVSLGAVEGFAVDLRSKRKVQELNQTWCLAFVYVGGTLELPLSYWTRTLLALP